MKREIRRVEALRRLADAFLAIGPRLAESRLPADGEHIFRPPPPVSPSLAELS